MSPKGRKSVSAWNLCETCKVLVSLKDLAAHTENSCPPSTLSWTHGYIKDGVLYGLLEEINDQDGMKNIPKLLRDDLVLVSQSVLQLCDIRIGGPVVVSIGGVSTVKTAWPTPEKSVVSIFMTREALELHWRSGCDNHVTVRKLKTQPIPAEQVYLELVEQEIIPHLEALLRSKYRKKILKTGDKLHLQCYGRDVFFTVSNILPFKVTYFCKESPESDELTRDLAKLAIEASESDDEYCRIVEETTWNIKMAEEESTKDRSSHRLSAVGGLSNVIEEMNEIIQLALTNTPLIPGLPVIRGILLYGVAGTGKTMLAEALAAESKVNIVRVCVEEINSKFLGETEARLRELFKSAQQQAPSIILMEEVDALCPKRGSDGSGGSVQGKRVVATLSTLLDSLHHSSVVSEKGVLVIATTSKPDAVDPALRRPGRLDQEIEISVPSPEARLEILQKHLNGTQHQVTEEDLKSVAFSAHGFVGADLASLCSHALMQAMKRATSGFIITVDDFAWALTRVRPSAMREILIDVPNVRWSDIGGQHDLKLKLQQAVDWPLKHPEAFVRLGISPPKGVLMYGPPGCSKTMIAKALATESKHNFISIKGLELFSKWVGESERAVREVFRKARQVAPAIVFFDEIDALCGERSVGGDSSGSNVQDRVLAQFLTELDGVEPLGNVIVVGATNRPDRIDKALLRPGRLDRILYVPLPDADARREIFEIKLRKMAVASDVDINELVSKTEKYSGAEVMQVCHEAVQTALVEDLNVKCVSWRHFNRALEVVTPRTSESQLQLYATFQQQ